MTSVLFCRDKNEILEIFGVCRALRHDALRQVADSNIAEMILDIQLLKKS